MRRSPSHSVLSLVADALTQASSPAEVLGVLPSLAAPLPPLRQSEDGQWSLLSACGEELVGPVVERVLRLAGRPLPGSDARSAALRQRVVGLALEGGYESLDGSSSIALTLVYLARAAICGGSGLLATLGEDHQSALRGLARKVAAMPPAELGVLIRTVGAGLSRTLDEARSEVQAMGARADGLALADELLAQGLLLVPERSRQDLSALGLAADARRLEVGMVLLDRLILLGVGSDGRLLGPRGPLRDAACDLLLVPRGERAVQAFVVALRLDALAGRLESSPVAGRAQALIGAAWHQLVADAPDALHQRVGCLGLSTFTSGLDAVAFAERSTRTLSGPRFLDAGEAAPAFEVGPDVRVSAGIAWGRIQGGTDGRSVALDGRVVGRALALAATRPAIGAAVRHLGRESGGGVHIDAEASAQVMVEAAAQGRCIAAVGPVVSPDGTPFACQGVWESLGRQLVLVGEATALLVSVDEGTFGPGRGLPGTEDESEPIALVAPSSDEAGRAARARWPSVDLLATDSLLGERVAGPADPARDSGGPWIGAANADDEHEVPAWDATGFSLPEYSQDINAEDLIAQLDAHEDPISYSLEVDDDYGFEDEEPARTGRGASGAVLAEAPPGRPMQMRSILPEDLDVFAFPGMDGAAGPRTRPIPRLEAEPRSGSEDIFQVEAADPGSNGAEPAADSPQSAVQGSPPPRRASTTIPVRDLANLFLGYVVFSDGSGGYTFGLRDGNRVRDAHCYETLGDTEAAYRAFLQAKVAEGLVPRLDLWSPLPTGARLEPLDPALLQRAYLAMVNP